MGNYYTYRIQEDDTLKNLIEKFRQKKLSLTKNLVIDQGLKWQDIWHDEMNTQTGCICYKGFMNKEGKNETEGSIYAGELVHLPYKHIALLPSTDAVNRVIIPSPDKATAIPIIFLPGIMESRLKNTAGKMIWDPDAQISMARVAFFSNATKKRSKLGLSKVPQAELITDNNGKFTKAQIDRGYSTIASGFYKELLEQLENELTPINNKNIFYPIYACGYDWRKDITKIAEEEIKNHYDNINKKEDFENLIIITHSMGGIVAREFLRQNPDISQKVQAVIHCVQPAAGATVFYDYFKCGTEPFRGKGLSELALSKLLGSTKKDFATLCSDLPGAIELAPTNHFNKNWLSADADLITECDINPAKSDIFDCYLDPTGILGLTDKSLSYEINEIITDNIETAKIFHDVLGTICHPKTYEITSSNIETQQTVRLIKNKVTSKLVLNYHNSKKKNFNPKTDLHTEAQKKLFNELLLFLYNLQPALSRIDLNNIKDMDSVLIARIDEEMIKKWNFQDPRIEIEVRASPFGDGTVPLGSQEVLSSVEENNGKIQNKADAGRYKNIKHSEIFTTEINSDIIKIIKELEYE